MQYAGNARISSSQHFGNASSKLIQAQVAMAGNTCKRQGDALEKIVIHCTIFKELSEFIIRSSTLGRASNFIARLWKVWQGVTGPQHVSTRYCAPGILRYRRPVEFFSRWNPLLGLDTLFFYLTCKVTCLSLGFTSFTTSETIFSNFEHWFSRN